MIEASARLRFTVANIWLDKMILQEMAASEWPGIADRPTLVAHEGAQLVLRNFAVLVGIHDIGRGGI